MPLFAGHCCINQSGPMVQLVSSRLVAVLTSLPSPMRLPAHTRPSVLVIMSASALLAVQLQQSRHCTAALQLTACLLSCVAPAESGCAGRPRSPLLLPARSLPQNMMNPRSTDPTHQMRPVGSLLTAEAQNSPQLSPSFLPRPEPLPQSPNPQHQTSSPTHVL